jgi:sugar phosphate isomerase/epimerase
MAECGCTPETVSSSTIGFMLAPRINAAGRMGMIDLAVDLGTNIVSTHIGHIPDDENDPVYQKKLETFKIVGKYADDLDVYLAAETGRETPEVLKKFLLNTGCKSATVNLDPANLAMCIGADPVEAVYTLGDLIVHTHVKDGIKTGETTYMETPLGEGSVDFPRYLKALQDIGYDGYLTIERGGGEDRVAEIRKAFDFIREELRNLQ